MGLLDFMQDPKQAGLLMAAARMAEMSGPSRTPVGIGQILGGGLGAFMQTNQAMKQQQMQDAEQEQMQQYRGMQMQGMEQQQQAAKAALQRAQALQQHMAKLKTPQAAMLGQMDGPTVANAEALQQPQENPYQRHMSMADHLRAGGYDAEANEYEDRALKFAPKVKNWEKVNVNGRILLKPYFEDGTDGAPVTTDMAEKLEFRDGGGTNDAFNPYTGQVVSQQRKTQSPDSIASAAATREIANASRYAADQQRNQATEMKLGDDYRTQSKGFKEVSDAYRTINSSLDKATLSPAATLASATKFMKLLDPGSVVRESELGMALAASGVFDRATNYYETLKRGKVLTPTQVKDFRAITQQIYQAAQQGQLELDANYRRQAKTYGLRPEMIIQDLGQNGKVKKYNPATGRIE